MVFSVAEYQHTTDVSALLITSNATLSRRKVLYDINHWVVSPKKKKVDFSSLNSWKSSLFRPKITFSLERTIKEETVNQSNWF
jgi:hypothetical protein